MPALSYVECGRLCRGALKADAPALFHGASCEEEKLYKKGSEVTKTCIKHQTWDVRDIILYGQHFQAFVQEKSCSLSLYLSLYPSLSLPLLSPSLPFSLLSQRALRSLSEGCAMGSQIDDDLGDDCDGGWPSAP